MNDSFSLDEKTILVTGASSGIGKQIAISCASSGGNIVLTARNEERLEEVQRSLKPASHEIICADLNLKPQINDLVENCPQLDGLVLNAGLVKTMPLKYLKSSSVENLFMVNIQSSILLVNRLIKKKKLNPHASICFISSIASKKSTPGNAVYSATKGAVNSFAQAIALELAGKQIRSNAILPGFVETNIIDNGSIDKENLKEHSKNYPLGRFGKTTDIANLVIYLLSDASEWMTGSLLTIDGGFSLK